jgi:hypothetical protein
MSRRGMMGALADMSEYRPGDDWRDTVADRFPEQDWTYTPPPDANEAAAARLARPYAKANRARMEETHPVAELAESLAPKEPWQYGLMFAGPGAGWVGRGIAALPTVARTGAAALGFGLTANEAFGKPKMGSVLNVGDIGAATRKAMPKETVENWLPVAPTVQNAQRVFSPGIYKNPRIIAEKAAAQTAPEHPSMKALFGVTREDLWEIGKRGTRQGNIEPSYKIPAKPGGSYVSDAVMNEANARRIIDTLGEAERYPQLIHGMDSWYVMDPAFQEMVRLVGFDQAKRDYQRFNTVVPMFSPGSEVNTEINRGTAANMMIERGKWPVFERHGGTAMEDRGPRFPKELRDVIGHAYHSTAQAGPVGRYLETGVVDMSQPKVPLYMQASGVPETGFQTKLPVPDAHWTRGIGAADVRTTAKPGVSMKGPEYHAVGPWYRENVAKPLGIEAVPAQGRQWGVMAPQTGVETAVGAPKLELLSQRIWDRALKLGIDPKKLRDDVLTGKGHAAWAPLGVMGAGAMGGVADQRNYNY